MLSTSDDNMATTTTMITRRNYAKAILISGTPERKALYNSKEYNIGIYVYNFNFI